MRHKWIWLLVGWLVIVGMVGCGRSVSSLSADTAPTPRPVTPVGGSVASTATFEPAGTPTPLRTVISPTQAIQEEKTVAVSPTIPSPSNPALQELVTRAKEDLASRLSIAVNQISLVEVKAVEWSDASLGCPEPGKVYAQVITPGYLIVLEAAGESYQYHSDAQRRVVCCEPQQAWPVLGDESAETVELAKEDLARRLGIPADNVAVIAVLRQEFPSDAFYCRTTKERISRDEPPVIVSGESILLSAAGRTYEYHASDQTVIFCRQLP